MRIWKYHLITCNFQQYLFSHHIIFLSIIHFVFLIFPLFIIFFIGDFLLPASSTTNTHFCMSYFYVMFYFYLQKMSLIFLNNDIPNIDNNDHTWSTPSSTETWSLPVSSCPTPTKFPFSSSFFYSSLSYFFLCFLIWPAWPWDVGNYLKQYLQVYNGFFLVLR